MTTQQTEIERRVAETLRSVGAQVGVDDDLGFDRIRSELTGGQDSGSPRSTPGSRIWAAAAALLVVALGAGALYAIDRGALETETAGPTDDAERTGTGDGGAPLRTPTDLFLLPSPGTDLGGGVYFGVQPSTGAGEALVVGRRTDNGFDQLVLVAHQLHSPTFGLEGRDVTVAGRAMIEPRPEPVPDAQTVVAEQLPDGSWIEYTAGDGLELVDVVAGATTFEDGEIVFEADLGGVEVLGQIDDLSTWDSTIVGHPVSLDETVTPADNPFTLTTAVGDQEALLLVYGAFLGPVERTTVDGQPGFIINIPTDKTDLDYPVTALAWTMPSGHGALLVSAMTEAEARAFIAGLRPVDRQVWFDELNAANEVSGNINILDGPFEAEAAGDGPDTPDAAEPARGPHRLATPTVSLDAAEIDVIIDGERIGPPLIDDIRELDVDGDPGTWNEYTTLELTWFEDAQEHRINLYVTSDGVDWWVDEIRTYDGKPQPEWITTEGEFFRTPLGEAFEGDLDLDHLKITDMRMQPFTRPMACDGPSPEVAIVATTSVIDGVVFPDEEDLKTGYGAWFLLFDTTACEPVSAQGQTVSAIVNDPGVALVQEALTDKDGVGVSLEFVAPGQASLTVEVYAAGTDELIDSVQVPVIVTEAAAD